MAKKKNNTASLTSPKSRGEDVSLQVMVPTSIKRQVSVRAAKEGLTQRTIILMALRAIGFSIEDRDLHDKRKVR